MKPPHICPLPGAADPTDCCWNRVHSSRPLKLIVDRRRALVQASECGAAGDARDNMYSLNGGFQIIGGSGGADETASIVTAAGRKSIWSLLSRTCYAVAGPAPASRSVAVPTAGLAVAVGH